MAEPKSKNSSTTDSTPASIEEALQVIGDLNEKVAGLNEKLSALQKESLEKDEIISEIRAQRSSGAKVNPSFEIAGIEYEVGAPKFRHNGVNYSAEELCKNSALQKELIEMCVGFIQARNGE